MVRKDCLCILLCNIAAAFQAALLHRRFRVLHDVSRHQVPQGHCA